jgi:hypothetical protein
MSMMTQKPDKPRTFFVECPACGRNVAIASGFVAMNLTRPQVHKSLIRMGWQTLPQLKCNLCIKHGI